MERSSSCCPAVCIAGPWAEPDDMGELAEARGGQTVVSALAVEAEFRGPWAVTDDRAERGGKRVVGGLVAGAEVGSRGAIGVLVVE